MEENARRGKHDPEYELLDTGVFDDDRYWIVEVDYAKADPHDLLMVVRVTNAGPDADTLHVLPTAWYRNTWSWDVDAARPELRADGDRRSRPSTRSWATWSSSPTPAPDGTAPDAAVLRQRDQRRPALRVGRVPAVPQGRHQRPRRRRAPTR